MHPITFPRPSSFPRGDPVLTPRQKQKSSMNGEGASRQGESKRRRFVFVVGEECGNAPALCQTALKGVKAHSASVGKRGGDRAHTRTRCIFLHRWEKHKGGRRTVAADRWKSVTFWSTLLSWGTDRTIFHLICSRSGVCGTAGRWGLARAPSVYLCGPLRGHCTSCDACGGDAGKVPEVYEWRDSPGGI